MANAGAITVFLADDNVIVREGVRAMLRHEPDIEVLGTGEDYETLVEGAVASEVQVVVSDIRMPPTFQREGIDACKEIRKRMPGTGGFGDDLRVIPADELVGSTTIDCGLAGTVMRFLPPVAALALGPTTFDGDEGARRRPMGGSIHALQSLGVDLDDDGRGALPFTVHGTGRVEGGPLEIDASASSQFVSGLLLSAARFERGLDLRHTGERLPSLPHIEMTIETPIETTVAVGAGEDAATEGSVLIALIPCTCR